MLKLFKSTDKVFNSNGDKIVQPLKARIRKEDNGDFFLELETSLVYANDIVERAIVVAPTPQGEQAFRVGNVQKTRSKISTKAWHVFFDSDNFLIEDSYVVNKNCNDALVYLNKATSDISPFSVFSDINILSSFRCVRHSLREAVDVILSRWGGHIVRDNFHFEIRETIGKDNGVTVRYAKNLQQISCDENWNEVVTKLLPVGKDGILLNAVDKNADLYVYSTVKYELPYTKKLNFTQELNDDDFRLPNGNLDEINYKKALVEDLKKQAQEYVAKNQIPKVNYELKANLEQAVDIGDKIEVIDERLGVNIFTNVIAYEYDCLTGKYVSVEFGNFKKKLSDILGHVSSTVSEKVEHGVQTIQVSLAEDLREATKKIWDFFEMSNVVYEGNQLLILDRIPKEIAKNVLRLDSAGLSFSTTGVSGDYKLAWSIDNFFNFSNTNFENFSLDLLHGGTLKLGRSKNSSGILKLFDNSNNLIAELSGENGFSLYGKEKLLVACDMAVGFAMYSQWSFLNAGREINSIADLKPFFQVYPHNGQLRVRKLAVNREIEFSKKFKILPCEDGCIGLFVKQ